VVDERIVKWTVPDPFPVTEAGKTGLGRTIVGVPAAETAPARTIMSDRPARTDRRTDGSLRRPTVTPK
jgi:hypothetical protein